MDLSTVEEIWVPIIYITNALNVVKLGSFGGADMALLWYKHPSVFQYSEVLKVRIFCKMDFQEFPFDVHQCYWKLRNWLGWLKYVTLNQPSMKYRGGGANSTQSTEIEIKSNRLNFNAYLNSNESSIVNENGYDYSEAAIQIRLARNKIGLLKIIWGYYVTTGTFSMMSLLSFFVDPSVVPGRMGMLVTLYLMLINSHNSVEAPSGRGFSNIEIWFISVQIPIAFGIIEYGAILAMKRFSKISQEEVNIIGNFSYEPLKLMDILAFIFSSLYFLMFVTLYMITRTSL